MRTSGSGLSGQAIERNRCARRRHAGNLRQRRRPARPRHLGVFQPQPETTFAEHEAGARRIERRHRRVRLTRGIQHAEPVVNTEEEVVDRVDAAGYHRIEPPLTQQIDRRHDRRQARGFLVRQRGVWSAQLHLEAGQAGRGVANSAVEEQRRGAGRAAGEERGEVVGGGLTPGTVRPEHHASTIVPRVRQRVARLCRRLPRDDQRERPRVVHPAQLHGRNPLRWFESGNARREHRQAPALGKRRIRSNGRTAFEQRVAEPVHRIAERRHDAEAGDDDGSGHGEEWAGRRTLPS